MSIRTDRWYWAESTLGRAKYGLIFLTKNITAQPDPKSWQAWPELGRTNKLTVQSDLNFGWVGVKLSLLGLEPKTQTRDPSPPKAHVYLNVERSTT